MNYFAIEKCNITNGPGIRAVLWTAGCSHHCPGCHNPETWDCHAGKLFTVDESLPELLKALQPDYIAGLTISGGDPLHRANQCGVETVTNAVRLMAPKKTIWLYTGFKWEELLTEAKNNAHLDSILHNIDVLVDGEYVEGLRDISLPYCGSSNQRVIDAQKSLMSTNGAERPVLYKHEYGKN